MNRGSDDRERRMLVALHRLAEVLRSQAAGRRAQRFYDRHGCRLMVRGDGLRRGRQPIGCLLPGAKHSEALLRSHSMGGRIGKRPRRGGHGA